MPFLLVAIGAVVGAIGTAVAAIAGAITGVLGSVGLGGILGTHIIGSLTLGKLLLLGVTMIASSLLAKASGLQQGSELTLKLDPTMPRQILLGEVATGGSGVYAFTHELDGDQEPNQRLVRVTSLSDVPCTGLVRIVDGSTVLAFEGDITTGMYACTSYRGKHGEPHMWARLYLGSYTPTADAYLISIEPSGLWTSEHKGVGQCYLITEFRYDAHGVAFPNGEPNLTYIMQGAALYDQRNDSTRSDPTRTGDQRLDDPSTWAYSNNTSVLIQSILRGWSINGSLILGAQADDRDLLDSMLINAYNLCDITVTTAISPYSEPLYTSGYIATATQTTQDMLQDLTFAQDGEIWDRGGQITILPGTARDTVMDITDEDIDWSEQASWQPQADLSSLYNTITGSFVSSTDNFQSKPYPIKYNDTFVTADGEDIILTRDFKAINSGPQVQRVTQRLLLESRLQGLVSFIGPMWLLELEQGDWFNFTSARWGFEGKVFEVMTANVTKDMKVAIIAKETSASIDDYDVSQELDLTSATGSGQFPPATVFPPPTNLAVVLGSDFLVSWRNPISDDYASVQVYRATYGAGFGSAVAVSPILYGLSGENMSWHDTTADVMVDDYEWYVKALSVFLETSLAGPATDPIPDDLLLACSGTVSPIWQMDFKNGNYWDGTNIKDASDMVSDTSAIVGGYGLQLDYTTPSPAYTDLSGEPVAEGATGTTGLNIDIIDPTFFDIINSGFYTFRMNFNMPAPIAEGNAFLEYGNDSGAFYPYTPVGFLGMDGPFTTDTNHVYFESQGGEGNQYNVADMKWSLTDRHNPSSIQLTVNGTIEADGDPVLGLATWAKIVAQNAGSTSTGPYTGTTLLYMESLSIYQALDDACMLESPSPEGIDFNSVEWHVDADPILVWTEADTPADHYRVLRNSTDDASTATDISGSLPTGTTTYTDTTATKDGTHWYWWVAAYDPAESYLTVSARHGEGIQTSHSESITTTNSTGDAQGNFGPVTWGTNIKSGGHWYASIDVTMGSITPGKYATSGSPNFNQNDCNGTMTYQADGGLNDGVNDLEFSTFPFGTTNVASGGGTPATALVDGGPYTGADPHGTVVLGFSTLGYGSANAMGDNVSGPWNPPGTGTDTYTNYTATVEVKVAWAYPHP